jgi:hypothetical protein
MEGGGGGFVRDFEVPHHLTPPTQFETNSGSDKTLGAEDSYHNAQQPDVDLDLQC